LEDVMAEEVPNVFEIMSTRRSMRRLKPEPVPAELIRQILKAGVSAPSGGNMQRWQGRDRSMLPNPSAQE
jgi:hypothetical protein